MKLNTLSNESQADFSTFERILHSFKIIPFDHLIQFS